MVSVGAPSLSMGDSMASASMMEVDSAGIGADATVAAPSTASLTLLGTTASITTPAITARAGRILIGTFLSLAVVLAIIAFVMVLVVYFRERHDHQRLHSAMCCCKESQKCLCRLQDRVERNAVRANSLLGNFEFTDVVTGTVAATAMSLITTSPAANTVVPVPFAGTATALSFTASTVPTAGSVTAFLTKNGAATSLSVTLDSTALTSHVIVATGSVTFVAGDLLGVSFSQSALALTLPATYTAQLFVNYTV